VFLIYSKLCAYGKAKGTLNKAYLHFRQSLVFVSEIGYTFPIEVYILESAVINTTCISFNIILNVIT
jgi:hypothetical protein